MELYNYKVMSKILKASFGRIMKGQAYTVNGHSVTMYLRIY